MEFWGVEVPSGKPLSCKPGNECYVHVSQAALGETKSGKGNDRVVLKVKVGEVEVVVGTLSQGKCDQTTLDLIFEKEFVLSHNSSGSVYFSGYKADDVKVDVSGSSDEEDDEFKDSEDDDAEGAPELVQRAAKENGKLGLKAAKPEASAGNIKPTAKSPATKVETEMKPKGKPVVIEDKSKIASVLNAANDEDDDDDDDDDEDDDDDDDDEDEDDEMLGSSSDEVDSDEEDDDVEDEDDSEEEEQPKSLGKKRPAPPVQTLGSGKKSKSATPGKVETKAPSTPASTPKQQQQQSGKKDLSTKKTAGKDNTNTPALAKKLGQYFCQPCNKNFNSESALSQHQTAKHK